MKRDLNKLPDPYLAYFTVNQAHFYDYLEASYWAQQYAYKNRQEIMKLVLNVLKGYLPAFNVIESINCHHNYVNKEEHFGQQVYLARKGAISARLDELGIIPGSMGGFTYIVKGKGNPISFFSSAHGAGRVMSRMQAKKRFSKDNLIRETQGVECRKDNRIIDELPSAYKDIDAVMKDQSDLVTPVHKLKQLICIKG